MNRENIIKNFENALNEALVGIYGKVPSAESFARQFNLRAKGASTISRETARKWMTGKSYPEPGKMSVLISWLQLNPSDVIDNRSESEALFRLTPALTSTDISLNESIKALDANKRSILLLIALALLGNG